MNSNHTTPIFQYHAAQYHAAKRRVLALVTALAVGLLLTACGNDQPAKPANSEAAAAASPAPPVLPLRESTLPDTLPTDLVWQTNLDDEVFADSNAKRGGTFYTSITSFPLTFRRLGPDSNGAFAGMLRPGHLGLIGRHPNTLKPIPLLATHWAIASDGKSVYYRLDPTAKWSDGKPVTAEDFLFTIEIMRSPHIVAPWYNDYYTNRIVDLRKYADDIIAVQLHVARPTEELLTETGIAPTPRHFHELNSNWIREYNWKIEPNTGPYQIASVNKGKSIEFERKEDWWGDQQRYLANRFNPDRINVRVIRTPDIAWKHFLRGELDTFGLTLPDYWHDRAQGGDFAAGFIHKLWLYTDGPQSPSGMWLNSADPILSDRNVRFGLAHSMNVQRVIDTILRGDYERMRTHYEGMGDYTNLDIQPRRFDLAKAEEYFELAGWAERGSDGIRVKDGQLLSLRVVYGAPHHTPRLVIIQEEAKKAGVELTLQLLDGAASFKQIQEKKHQIGWMSWAGGNLSPAYWEFYHSDNANKAQTNNTTNLAVPEIDALIEQYRNGTDRAERIKLAHAIEQRVHEEGVLIPTFKVPYVRNAYWNWVKLPENLGTRTTNNPLSPMVDGLFWLDPEEKKATNTAREQGQTRTPVVIKDERWRVR